MTDKEAMKLALDALKQERENYRLYGDEDGAPEYIHEAIKALEEALAKQEQGEPVAWLQIGVGPLHDGDVIARTTKPKEWNPEWWRFEPLYTTPQQRTWVGTLSLEQLLHTAAQWGSNYPKGEGFFDALSKKVQQWIEFYSGETYMNPPQQRTWVGLTPEEIEAVWVEMCGPQRWAMHSVYARKLEAKLKEKNT